MTKKKSSAIKQPIATWKSILQDAKTRLPSERSKVRCVGCFNPRNTLTVKGNLEHVFMKEQIELRLDKTGVNVPCSKCKVIRFLSLSKFSFEVLESDLDLFKGFVLLKDDKYNSLVGIDVTNLPIDLKEWS